MPINEHPVITDVKQHELLRIIDIPSKGESEAFDIFKTFTHKDTDPFEKPSFWKSNLLSLASSNTEMYLGDDWYTEFLLRCG